MSLCLPHKMGRHIVFSSVVCLSVRPSVRPSVRLSARHTFVSVLYVLNPWWGFQITLHKCQVWWDEVQWLGLTKVGSRSRSQSKIKHSMTVFRVRSISFEPMVGFTNNFNNLTYFVSYIRFQTCIRIKPIFYHNIKVKR